MYAMSFRTAADKIFVTVTLRREVKPMNQSGYYFRTTYFNGDRNNSKLKPKHNAKE